jgi:hypothetical protein
VKFTREYKVMSRSLVHAMFAVFQSITPAKAKLLYATSAIRWRSSQTLQMLFMRVRT